MNEHLSLRVQALRVHPVKSCAGGAVDDVRVVATGFAGDREFMVVDRWGEFVTQRECPPMQLIGAHAHSNTLTLTRPLATDLHVAFDAAPSPCTVRVWDDVVSASDCGDTAAAWLSAALDMSVRLVRFSAARPRLADARWCGGDAAPTLFSDGFPLLVTSTASITELNRRLALRGQPAVTVDRFRPNLVLDGLEANDEDWITELTLQADDGEIVLRMVKPCTRCGIPNVDPACAVVGVEPGATLATYRADSRMGGALTFGMNAIVVSGAGRTLRVGDRCQATLSV